MDKIPKHENKPQKNTKPTAKPFRDSESVTSESKSVPSKVGTKKLTKAQKVTSPVQPAEPTKVKSAVKALSPPRVVVEDETEMETDFTSEYSATEDDVESLAEHETSGIPMTDFESLNNNIKHKRPKQFKKEILSWKKVLQLCKRFMCFLKTRWKYFSKLLLAVSSLQQTDFLLISLTQ